MGQLVITHPQRDYIESLCAKLGYSTRFALSEGLNLMSVPLNQLTRKKASELIDWLLSEKEN